MKSKVLLVMLAISMLHSAFAADTLGVWEGSSIDASSHARMDLALDLSEESGNAKYEIGFGIGVPPEEFGFDTNVTKTSDVSMRIIDSGDDMGKAVADGIYAYWKIRSAADFGVSVSADGNLSGVVPFSVSADGIDEREGDLILFEKSANDNFGNADAIALTITTDDVVDTLSPGIYTSNLILKVYSN